MTKQTTYKGWRGRRAKEAHQLCPQDVDVDVVVDVVVVVVVDVDVDVDVDENPLDLVIF